MNIDLIAVHPMCRFIFEDGNSKFTDKIILYDRLTVEGEAVY